MVQPTLVCCVLDKSGSMQHLQRSTIEGFNSFLYEQQRQPGDCRLSLTQFDTSFQVDYVAQDINAVAPLSTYSYLPGGGTALLDAVGTTIKGAEQWIMNNNTVMPWYPAGQHPKNRGWKVLVVTFTDGDENSSHQWHINQPMVPGDDRDLAGLIQWKQNEGWDFMFLGTGGSGWLEKTFSHVVTGDRFYSYAATSDAHSHTYSGLSSSVSTYRGTEGTGNFTFNPGAANTLDSTSKGKTKK